MAHILWDGVLDVPQNNPNVELSTYGRTVFARLNLHIGAALNCCPPLRFPLEGAARRTEGILLKNKYSALRHTSSVSQARHLLLKEKAIFYCQQCVLSGRTQFAPNGVQLTLRFCLRDAEDVIPYDLIKTVLSYYQ